jgi:hypothetical protein
VRGTGHAELGGTGGQGRCSRGTQKAAAIMVDAGGVSLLSIAESPWSMADSG